MAADLGLAINYEQLPACGATLVGAGESGRATVHASGNHCRERFVAAHELGHWLLHRGRTHECAMHEADVNLAKGTCSEVEADTFAMHFLMPKALFASCFKQRETPDFLKIQMLSERFGVTLAAALLRFIEVSSVPVIAASFHRKRLRWSVSSDCVGSSWKLKSVLSEHTPTHNLIFRGEKCNSLTTNWAHAWFEDRACGNYSVLEQCWSGAAGQAFVLLYLQPEMMKLSRSGLSRARLASCR
jgi:hypothetical protein